ncbi:MAG: peptide chain release factor 2, partial [Bacteroidota bacterium]|nr:peptide chain release factor 2 [Bacteroidota bacterium]
MDSLTIEVQNKEEKTLAPDFWDDTTSAEAYIRALQPKKQWLEDIANLSTKIDDLSVLLEFSKSGDDVSEDLNTLHAETKRFIEDLEFKNM